MKIMGTQTKKNILAAFKGESSARTRYLYFSEQARKEGRNDIAELFDKMATNETAHARIWFNLLNGVGNSRENLVEALSGEHLERKDLYPSFAQQAREEGLPDIAEMFERIAEIEYRHEIQFRMALRKLGINVPDPEDDNLPELEINDEPQEVFICSLCGDVQPATNGEPPYDCRVCGALGSIHRETR